MWRGGGHSFFLNPIITSANRTPQDWIEVNSSVLSISEKELQNLSITSTTQLEKVFPGLQLKNITGPGYTMGTIRGLNSRVNHQTIGLYIDGIPQDFGFLSQELIDVKSIEFLRGPQGTLYGIGGYGGLIDIVTHNIDSSTLRVKGSSDISYLRENIVLAASSPLVPDWLFVGGNFSYTRENGMITDKTRDQRIDTSDTWGGNASIAFFPKDSGFKALFKYSNHTVKDNHYSYSITEKMFKDKDLSVTPSLFQPFANNNLSIYSLRLEQKFNQTSLSNVLSYQDYSYDWHPINSIYSSLKRKTLTEELKASTLYDNGAFSTFGIYYQNGNFRSFFGSVVDYTTVNNHSFAVYGDGKIPLGELFDLNIGLRYSFDISSLKLPALSKTTAPKDNSSEHILSPKISFGFNANEHNHLYILYSSGHLSGGFFEYAGDKVNSPFKAERSQNLELGIHSSFWDNKINLNADIYGIYITDKHFIQTRMGQLYKIINLGNAYSAGLETNIKTAPFSSLLLSFGGSFGHAAYIKVQDLVSGKNYDNKTLQFAPDVSMNLNIDWNFLNISKAKFFLNLNGNFYSKIYFEDDAMQEPYFVFDGALRMEYAKFVVNFSISNAFNQFYSHYVNRIGDIRNIGLSIKYEL